MDLLKQKLWKTKDGRIMSIGTMETDHILRCIEDLKSGAIRSRDETIREAFVNMFQEELGTRARVNVN